MNKFGNAVYEADLENGAADICVTKRRSYDGGNRKSQCQYELRYYNASLRMTHKEATSVVRALLAAMRDNDDITDPCEERRRV